MPTTIADLERWRKEKDAGKFHQILTFLDDDKYLPMRLYAIESLGMIRDPASIPYLVREYRYSSESEKAVEDVLSAWGSPAAEVLVAIAERRENERRGIAGAAVILLSTLDFDTIVGPYTRWLMAGEWVHLVRMGIRKAELIDRFVDLLRDPDPRMRWGVLDVLRGAMITKPRCEVLARALEDEDVQVRVKAFWILYDYFSDFEPERLEGVTLAEYNAFVRFFALKGLKDEDWLIRYKVIDIARKLKDEECRDLIVTMAGQKDDPARAEALKALQSFNHKGTLQMLTEIYRDEQEDEGIRSRALLALGSCRDKGSYALAKQAFLKEEGTWIRFSAADGMLNMNPEAAVPEIVDAILEKPQRCLALGRCRNYEYQASDVLFSRLETEEDGLRVKVILWLLAMLGKSGEIVRLCESEKALSHYLEYSLFAVYLIIRSESVKVKFGFELLEKDNQKIFARIRVAFMERLTRWGSDWPDPLLQELGVKEEEEEDEEDVEWEG